jgi:hypothetical protein
VLLLALGISRHEASIFEVELNFLPWLPGLHRLGFATTILGNTPKAAQDLPNRRLGAWQAQTGVGERRITVQVVQDRFWARHALQVLGWSGAHLQDALHDGRLRGDRGRRGLAGTRAGVQRHHILLVGLAQALEPLAHPGA